mmetsp:Transcript_16552/g.37059  ORF Transcript_16552/g.37059 Transcript_16552/m.37059 type:complete len:364 (-) Transcript_16552:89-1180(-)
MSEDGGGGWGLSSMSAALGGWGLSSAEEPTPAAAAESSSDAAADTTAASAEQEPTDGTGDKPPPPPPRKEQDDEWKETVREVEDAAASVVPAIQSSVKELEGGLGAMEETAARIATDAASSFWTGASSYFAPSAAPGGGGGDADAASPAADGADAGGGGVGTATNAAADVLTSVLQYNPLNSLASKWINELEKADDEHRPLRAHLLAHLKEWERSTYEEWVEECLVAIDGWDRSSAVVDGTFYEEDSLHRRLWNQRMEAIGDEGRTVEARGAAGKTPAAPGGGPTASVDDETRTRATPAKTAAAKESAAPAAEKSSTAKKEDKGGTVTSTSAVAAAIDLLDNDDDLDGLLGDEEICFVSKPSD